MLKVSIVLPIYNQELFLRDAISDVLNQTHSDIEVILVNDGSTDSSPEIISEYAASFPAIRVITQENGGLLAANVSGIKAATGDYICFYDPDDRIGPRYIESFLYALDKEYDFVARGITYEFPGKSVEFPLKEDKVFTEDELRRLSSNYILSPTMAMDNTIFVARWNKLYRTSLLKSFVDEYAGCGSVSLGEDTVFTYLLLQHAKNGKSCVDSSSYRYVQHDYSMTHAVVPDMVMEKCDFTYERFSEVIMRYSRDLTPARLLYCAQIVGALSNAVDSCLPGAKGFYTRVMGSERFRKALACAHGLTKGKNANVELLYRNAPFSFYSAARKAYGLLRR